MRTQTVKPTGPSPEYTSHVLDHTMAGKINLKCRWCRLAQQETAYREINDLIEDPEG